MDDSFEKKTKQKPKNKEREIANRIMQGASGTRSAEIYVRRDFIRRREPVCVCVRKAIEKRDADLVIDCETMKI